MFAFQILFLFAFSLPCVCVMYSYIAKLHAYVSETVEITKDIFVKVRCIWRVLPNPSCLLGVVSCREVMVDMHVICCAG